MTSGAEPWLVVIDMQAAFGHPESAWLAEGYAEIVPQVEELVARFVDRVVFTRFVRDPAEPGAWEGYYDRWTSFRKAPDDEAWCLTMAPPEGTPVVDAPTFSKWGEDLAKVVGDAPLVLCGVATECCVLATALGAADAGHEVVVIADACAGATRTLHDQTLGILGSMGPLLQVKEVSDL